MAVLHVDFETFSEIDLTEVGAFRYAEDPSTEALIIAYAIGDREPVGVDLTRPGYLQKLRPLFDAIRDGARFCAHNVTFERNIWEKVCVPKLGFPVTPKPRQYDCTAVRARLIAIPGSLDGCSKALGVTQKKDERGKYLIQRFCKLPRIMPHEAPELFQEFIEYCKQDVRTEMAVAKILPPIPKEERDAFELDYIINDRGMPVNLDLVGKAIDYVQDYSGNLLLKSIELAGCRPTQRDRTLEFLASRGLELPNLQAATVEKAILQKGLDPAVREYLDSRIELSRAGTKKLITIRNCASLDGRIRGGYLFSAASTRRWSSVGVQMHNLQKPEGETDPDFVLDLFEEDMAEHLPLMFSRPLTAIAQSIRGFFESERGFLVGDYSSVEPRGLAWAADEKWLLKAYREGQDPYRIIASQIYKIAIEKITKDSKERFLGKQLILGAGYGMGPPRFVEACAKFGVTISQKDSEKAVYGYRNSVKRIVKFWHDMEDACIRATKFGTKVTSGYFTFELVRLSDKFKVLKVQMPSGCIYYPQPFIKQIDWYGRKKDTFNFFTPIGKGAYIPTDTFGGSVVENLVQAFTRDTLRDGMVQAHKDGHFLVGHTHDEAIAEGRQQDMPEFLRSITKVDVGWKLDCEGYFAHRYKK